jgi:hypothetical protein
VTPLAEQPISVDVDSSEKVASSSFGSGETGGLSLAAISECRRAGDSTREPSEEGREEGTGTFNLHIHTSFSSLGARSGSCYTSVLTQNMAGRLDKPRPSKSPTTHMSIRQILGKSGEYPAVIAPLWPATLQQE